MILKRTLSSYTYIGMLEEIPDVPIYDLHHEGYYMIRQMDCGVIIKHSSINDWIVVLTSMEL
ncbi:MAG: hypothetical protein ACP5GN_07790 [Fervidicoccaceae archaeon]|jgi:hypothetical protein